MHVLDSPVQKNDTNKPIYWKIEDHHYLTLWDKNDLPNVYKWQEKIRETHDEQLIKSFFDLMNRYHNDHKNNLEIEPHQVSKVDDVLTYKGIAKFCRLITLQDDTTFTVVAVGRTSGANTFVPFNDSLILEESYVTFARNGFFDAAGTGLRYGGTFGESMVTAAYSESLVRDTESAVDSNRIVMCLNNFQLDPINHTNGNTGFTAAGIIEFDVIMD